MIIKLALVYFLSFSLALKAGGSDDHYPKELDQKLQLINALPKFDHWKLAGIFDLSPSANMGHPQGLIVTDKTLVVSTSVSPHGGLVLFDLERELSSIKSLRFKESFSFPNKQKLYHAGGIHKGYFEDEILVPLSGTKKESPTFILSFDLKTLSTKKLTESSSHLGTSLYDKESKISYFFDYGSKKLIGYDFANHQSKNTFKPQSIYQVIKPKQYQDCKTLGGGGYFLCTGKSGHPLFNLKGFVDLIRIDSSGKIAENETQRFRIPHIRKDGSIKSYGGPYLSHPKIGYALLSINAFDFEIDLQNKLVRFYFIPHDHPRSRLYIYEVRL